MDYMGVKRDEDFKVIILGETAFAEERLVLIIKEDGRPVLMEEGMAVVVFGHRNVQSRVMKFGGR